MLKIFNYVFLFVLFCSEVTYFRLIVQLDPNLTLKLAYTPTTPPPPPPPKNFKKKKAQKQHEKFRVSIQFN
jgi:hypothetical protein